MKEVKNESKGIEYYKGYAAGYRDAMNDFGYILNNLKSPLEIPYRGWWDSPPMWNNPITTTDTTKYGNFSEAQQKN